MRSIGVSKCAKGTDDAEATYQKETDKVVLRGTYINSRKDDMPTLIWLPDLVESARHHRKFFFRDDNKIRDLRNIWLLDYRNNGESDHHPSYDMNVSHAPAHEA